LDIAHKECSEKDRQLQETIKSYNEDESLWKGKYAYLKIERDQYKSDYEKASQKYESTKS
jgi:hypothetical protein